MVNQIRRSQARSSNLELSHLPENEQRHTSTEQVLGVIDKLFKGEDSDYLITYSDCTTLVSCRIIAFEPKEEDAKKLFDLLPDGRSADYATMVEQLNWFLGGIPDPEAITDRIMDRFRRLPLVYSFDPKYGEPAGGLANRKAAFAFGDKYQMIILTRTDRVPERTIPIETILTSTIGDFRND